MSYIQLILPLPPSINHYWRSHRNRRFISKEGVLFREAVIKECAEQGVKEIPGRLAVYVSVYFATRRRSDIDNRLKSLLDALEHAGCYENDSQIDEIHIFRKEVRKGGACTVLILPLTSRQSSEAS